MTARFFCRLVLCLLVCLSLAPTTASASADVDPLPSWQGPVKDLLINYVDAVTKKGSPDFIPRAERIAAFDMDGTIIAERPLPFVFDVSLSWLNKNCPSFSQKGPRQAGLCRAVAENNKKQVKERIEDFLGLPFLGMDMGSFRSLCLSVFETYPNPVKKAPLKKLVYRPQLELIGFLHGRGFRVWVCSGSSLGAIQAISAKYLGVPPERCIGTRYALKVGEKGGRVVFQRGEVRKGLVNLGKVKAENLMLATVTGPVLAFGNSMGDSWMLKYASSSKRRSLALMLDHDDPREFIYSKKKVLKLAKKHGWSVVSMKGAWISVFD